MSEKLFYNVSKDKANDFKSSTSNVIGFVAETDNAGYIIANGKEYGKTRVSSSNSFSVNGTQYSIILDETGALSVNKYIATTIASVSLTSLSAIKTTTINGTSYSEPVEQYVGTGYSFTVGIKVVNTEQDIKINVANPTGNKYKLAIYDGSSYIFNDADFRTTDGEIVRKSSSVMADVADVSKSGTVAWAETKLSVYTEGEKTFTVYLTEEGKTTPLSKSAKQTNINATVSIIPMVPFLYGTTGSGSGCTTLIKNIKYDSVGTFDQNFEFHAGNIPTFAIASCLNKTLKCYNETGALEDTSLKYQKTENLTLNDCTTDYDIYIYSGGAWGGTAKIKVKF